MNIRKKVAVAAAVVLPLGGLAVLGGLGVVSAGAGGPVLTCQYISPGSGAAGGETYDNGGGPGSAGLYLDANDGTPSGKQSAETADDWSNATNTVELAMDVTTGETFTIPASDTANGSSDNTFTITSTSYPPGLLPSPPVTVTVQPPLALNSSFYSKGAYKPLGSKTAVTVNPTTATPYFTEDDITVSGSSVSFPTGEDSDLSSVSNTPISGQVSGINAVPSDTFFEYTGPGAGTLENDTDTGTVTATESGTGTFVVGYTDAASQQVSTDYDLAASGCATTDVAGYVAPTEATITGSSGGTLQNAALAVLGAPSGANLTISYPSLSSGYADDGGTGGTTLSSSEQFAAGKDSAFDLTGGPGSCANCDAFSKGTVDGDYSTAGGALSLEAVGIVACTYGQVQAITEGTGVDAAAGPHHVAEGANPLDVCDGSSGPTAAAAVYTELIALESNPGGSEYGSDGTQLAEIVAIQPQQGASAVI